MIGRAGSCRRIRDLAGICLGVIDELAHRLCRHGRVHHHRVGDVGEQRDRREILHAVERHGAEQRVVHRVHAHRVEQEHVAVRRRARDRGGSDIAGCARTILDDDRLPERLPQVLADDARENVRRSAGSERHNEGDRSLRIALRQSTLDRQRGCKRAQSTKYDAPVTHMPCRHWQVLTSQSLSAHSVAWRPLRQDRCPGDACCQECDLVCSRSSTSDWGRR